MTTPPHPRTSGSLELSETVDPITLKIVSVPQHRAPRLFVRRDWLIVDPASGPAKAALSFVYLNEDWRGAHRHPSPQGGRRVHRLARGRVRYCRGENVNAITFLNGAGQIVKVRLRTRSAEDLFGPRPTAVGPLYAGRPVILRPNPVNVDGSSLDLAEAQSEYDYDWTVTRFNANTGEWDPVTIGSAFGHSFTPTQTGTFDARVTMTTNTLPVVEKYGSVRFNVTPPPMTATTLDLQDDGSSQLEVDLQVVEPVSSDSVDVTVNWPKDLGSANQPSTTIQLPCVQTGPIRVHDSADRAVQQPHQAVDVGDRPAPTD